MKTLVSIFCKKSVSLTQAYFFTDFPAPTETGISETKSLGGKFLSLAKKSLSLANIIEFSEKKSLNLAKKSFSSEKNNLRFLCLQVTVNL